MERANAGGFPGEEQGPQGGSHSVPGCSVVGGHRGLRASSGIERACRRSYQDSGHGGRAHFQWSLPWCLGSVDVSGVTPPDPRLEVIERGYATVNILERHE